MKDGVSKPRQRGFTLVELMIVVAMIGVLSAIAFPKFQYMLAKAHYDKYGSWPENYHPPQALLPIVKIPVQSVTGHVIYFHDSLADLCFAKVYNGDFTCVPCDKLHLQ